MNTTDLIQTLILIATVFGLFVSISNTRKQLTILNKQSQLMFFADYTKRYQEIMLNFPENINESDFDYESLAVDVKNKTLRYMRCYFDLCSEELDLYQSNNIEERVWKNWEEGIEFSFSKKAFKDAWIKIKLDTIHYPEFTAWVNKRIKK